MAGEGCFSEVRDGVHYDVIARNIAGVRVSPKFNAPLSYSNGVQEAIADLPATGGMVYVPPGTHLVENILPKPHVFITGAGDASILKLRNARHSLSAVASLPAQSDITVVDGSQFRIDDFIIIHDAISALPQCETRQIQNIVGNVITVSHPFDWAHPIGVDVWTFNYVILINALADADVCITNLSIDGNRANQMIDMLGELFPLGAVAGSYWPECIPYDAGGSGVMICESSNIVVNHCNMYDLATTGVYSMTAGDDINIMYCRIKNTGEGGILTAGYSVPPYPSYARNFNCIGNYIYDVGNGTRIAFAGATWGDGIQWHGGFRDSIASGNYIEKCLRFGINIGIAGVDNNYRMIAAHNKISHCHIGICSVGGSGVLIIGNECTESDTSTTCITVVNAKYVDIIGNLCDSGIQTIYPISSETSHDVNIIGNYIFGQFDGFYIRACNDVLVSGNRVVLTKAYWNAHGVWLADQCDDYTIVGNVFKAFGTANGESIAGILVDNAASTGHISNNLIKNFRRPINIAGSGIIKLNKFKTYALDPIYGNTIYSDQYYEHHDSIRAEDTDYVHLAIPGNGAVQVIAAGITNPDDTRSLTITTTNIAAPAGNVIIDGISRGKVAQDTIAILAGGTRHGVIPFDTVTQITIPAGVTAADTVQIGIGSKLGVGNVFYNVADVYKVRKNIVDYSGAANITVNATYGTVDVSTGAAIVNDDRFTIYYLSNLNVLSP